MNDDDARPLPAPGWSLLHALAGFVGAVVFSQVFGSVVMAIAGVDPSEVEDVSLVVRTFLQMGLWIGLLGAVAVVLWRTGSSWRDLGLGVRPIDIPLGLVVGVACQAYLVTPVTRPWAWVLGRDIETLKEPACRLADKADDPLAVALFVLITVIAAPIVEEVFYRSFAQQPAIAMAGRMLGIPLIALAFGATHGQLLQLVPLSLFGLLLGIMTDRTGRLGLAIVTHMAFNGTVVVNLLAMSDDKCAGVLNTLLAS